MSKLTSAVWWRAAAIRAFRTALVVAIPYVPASYLGDVPYVFLASAAGLAAVLSLLTSLAGIAETEGQVETWYFAILSRVVKTVAQALVAGVGTAVIFADVDWTNLGQMALTAGFGSLLLAVLGTLPEAPKPLLDAGVMVTSAEGDQLNLPVVTNLPTTPGILSADRAAASDSSLKQKARKS